MTKLRVTNQAARCLIGRAEGLRLEAYLDGTDVWTIGWGTTRINGKPVTPGMTITKEQAAEYFNHDLAVFEKEISEVVKVALTNNQFSALISLIYNIGGTQFRSSTLLKKLNRGDYAGAANEFGRWIYDNSKILNGLIERREKEKQLFLTRDD
jgi:lysozyme